MDCLQEWKLVNFRKESLFYQIKIFKSFQVRTAEPGLDLYAVPACY